MVCERLNVSCEDEGICNFSKLRAPEFHCHMEKTPSVTAEPCGCQIMAATREFANGRAWQIVFCPLHAAAGEFRERLDRLAGEVGACWGMCESRIRAAVGNTNYNAVDEQLIKARAALKAAMKIEGCREIGEQALEDALDKIAAAEVQT